MPSNTTRHYLTPELINEVHRQAGDVIWRLGIWGKFTKNWYDVFTISPAGLIHISGNDDTGWKHIMERHGYFSNSSYFGSGAIGNPNKFNREIRPGEEYRNIGDDIFMQQQRDLRPHPDDQLFEKFKGVSSNYSGSDGTSKEFNLILYKGTRIVHSLYPTKNLEGKLPKRVLSTLTRSKTKINAVSNFEADYYIINIPYDNEEGITRYIIIFKLDVETMMAKGYLQLNDLVGNPVQTTYPHICYFKINTALPATPFSDPPIEFIRFINGLTLADLSKIELQIDKVEKDLQEYIQSKSCASSNRVS